MSFITNVTEFLSLQAKSNKDAKEFLDTLTPDEVLQLISAIYEGRSLLEKGKNSFDDRIPSRNDYDHIPESKRKEAILGKDVKTNEKYLHHFINAADKSGFDTDKY